METSEYNSILILSAKGSADDKVKGLAFGVDDYLVKPFDLEEFISWIESCERRANPARGLTAMCVDRHAAQ